MVLNIFSVLERTPPTNEIIIRLSMQNMEILDFEFSKVHEAWPENGEELELGETNLIWEDGTSVMYEDKWAYAVAMPGSTI